MDKALRVRWGFLLSALAATLAMVAYPDSEPVVSAVPRGDLVQTAPSVVVDRTAPERQIDWVATDENPFAPRGWVSPPVEPAKVASPVVAPVVADITPPPLAPLPFKFIGQMADGMDQVVYLGLGEHVLLARTGEVLEGTYKVLAITPTQIEFEFIASGVHQTLPLPGQDR